MSVQPQYSGAESGTIAEQDDDDVLGMNSASPHVKFVSGIIF
jgi:hypothetical protein